MPTVVNPAADQCGNHHSGRNKNLPEADLPSGSRRYATALRVPLQPLQVGANISSVLVAEVSVFLQTLVNDPFHFGWQVGIQPYWRNWLFFQNRIKNDSRTLTTERQNACCHLIEDDAEGKQIGARVQF